MAKEQANLKAEPGTIDKVNGNVNLKDNVVVTSCLTAVTNRLRYLGLGRQ